jgi:acyl-CoA synthetase (AMP-forming)/AMP-acid ligase II
VALQAWSTGGQVLQLGTNWIETWKLIDGCRPAALSCTPSFLDLLLQWDSGTDWSPMQITLGGEVLRTRTGRRFAARFPNARFTVIYASAEHGVLLKTHRLDGWYETVGFSHRAKEWRLRDEELELRQDGQWIATGDRIEVRGDLVRVLGRADGVVNVGGVKVSLDEISALAEEVPGVRRALAYPVASPVVGQIVGLKFALDSGQDRRVVQESLQTYLHERLRKEAWPRRWEIDDVGLGANSKRVRG